MNSSKKSIALTLIATLNDTGNYSSQRLLDTLTGVRAQETDASEITLTDQPTYITDYANAIIAVGDGDFYARYDNALSRGVINGPLKTMAITGRVSNVQMWAADGETVQLKLVLSKGPGVYAPTTQKGYVSYQDWDSLKKELEDKLNSDEESFKANYALKTDLESAESKLEGEIDDLRNGLAKNLSDTQKNLSDSIAAIKDQIGDLKPAPSGDSYALQSSLNSESGERKQDFDQLRQMLSQETSDREAGDNRLGDSITQLSDGLKKAQNDLASYATSDSLQEAIGKATGQTKDEVIGWIDGGNKTIMDVLDTAQSAISQNTLTQPSQLNSLATTLGDQSASIKAMQEDLFDLQKALDGKQNGNGSGVTIQMVDGGNKTIMDVLDKAYKGFTDTHSTQSETGINNLAGSLAEQEKRMDDLSDGLSGLQATVLDLSGKASDGRAASGRQVISWIDGGNKTIMQALEEVYDRLMSANANPGQTGLNGLASALANSEHEITQLQDLLNALGRQVDGGMMPVGIPYPYPLVKVPSGILDMVGQTFDPNNLPILAQMYPALILPDMRGVFIRGYDPDGKLDLEGPTRVIAKDIQRASLSAFGGKNGDMVAFSGPGATLERLHMDRLGEGDDPPFPYWNGSGSQRINTDNTVGRMRPDNVAFKWVVRAG